MPGGRRVILISPGGPLLPREIASALAEAGLLRRYVTSLAFGDRTLDAIPIERIRGKFLSRSVPGGIEKHQVARYRSAFEFYSLARDRLPGARFGAVRRLWTRSIKFGQAAAAEVNAHDAIVATFGSALEAFERGLAIGDVKGILDYPIAHHQHVNSVLSEEAEREPDFASTLEGQTFPESVTERLDDEIVMADHILTLSPAHAQSFIRAGISEDRLITAPLGVDSGLFSPRRVQRRSDDPFRVVFVGLITQRKGLSYALRGFERAFAGSKDAELLLVGPVIGSSRPWRKMSGVRHSSSVPRSMLPAIYGSADVFVMPSLAEGFAQTPLEAMSCGLPIVVSDATLGESVIEDGVNGFIVPVRDADAIAQVLQQLREHPELRVRVGQQARERSLDFTWRRFRAQITAELTKLLDTQSESHGKPSAPSDES